MSEIEWIECDDPERLAAAAQAGVRVEVVFDGDAYATDADTTREFAARMKRGYRFRIPSRVVWPPALTVPEGMTPERLRDAAQLVEDGHFDTAVDQINRWADDLAAQIEGGGADDREASGPKGALSADSETVATTPALPDDPFPVGCRVKHRQASDVPGSVIGRAGSKARVGWDDGASAWFSTDHLTHIDPEPDPADPDTWPLAETWEDCARHVEAGGVVMCGRVGDPGWDVDHADRYTHLSRDDAPGRGGYLPRRLVPIPAPESSPDGEGQVARRSRSEITDDFDEGTRTIREWVRHGSVAGPQLCEELDAWLWYWGGAADGSSPVGSDPLTKVTAERDALAARLAAWPEVPDGHEVVVVPSEVVDFYGSGNADIDGPWDNQARRVVDACRAAVDRRTKPEPRVERVPLWEAVGRTLPDGGVITGWWFDDELEASGVRFRVDDASLDGSTMCEGATTVEVLAEDGES